MKTQATTNTHRNTDTYKHLAHMVARTGMLVHKDNRTKYCYTGTGIHRHRDTQAEGHIEPHTYTHTHKWEEEEQAKVCPQVTTGRHRQASSMKAQRALS